MFLNVFLPKINDVRESRQRLKRNMQHWKVLKVRQIQKGFFKPTIPPSNERTNSFFCLTVLSMNEIAHSFVEGMNSRIPKSTFEIN